jgi:protein O-mannosyl-transferase
MNPRKAVAAAFLAAAALTALAYGRSLPYDFVYDDLWTIVRNPALRGDAGPRRFFADASTAAAAETGMGATIYRPFPTWTSALTFRAAGLRPAAWRGPNLLLHALNGFLVFLLLTRLWGLSAGAGALGGAVFLLHPVQVESVVWITQRSNLLCGAGGLAALLLAGRGSLWCLPCWALALLSKETAVTLTPFVAFAAMSSGAKRGRKAWLVGGILGLATAYLPLRTAMTGGLVQRAWRSGPMENALVGQAGWLEHVRLLLLPTGLTVSHEQAVGNPWEHPAPWAGLAVFAAWTCAAALLWRRGARRPALALAWVVAALSPHLGWLPLDTFAAERFLCLPVAGIAGLTALLWEARPRGRALLAAAVVALGAGAFRRTADWKDETSLWEAAVSTEPHAFARMALAEAYYLRGRWADAARETRLALAEEPSAPLVFAGLNNLSELALKEGRPGAALRFADRALRLQPVSPVAQRNRGEALAKMKG